jgi:hypothetical protein
MPNDESGSGSSDYVEWKGWLDQTAFGFLSEGEAAYFTSELKDVRVEHHWDGAGSGTCAGGY